MSDELKEGAAAPSGEQNVSVTKGQATNMVQAVPANGGIWFAFSIGTGTAQLSVNFNGQTYNNVPPGSYGLSGLTTTLNLTVQVEGSAKLAWVAA